MVSRSPQYASSYELTGSLGPVKKERTKVWYYEFPRRLEFHMSLYAGNHYRGHVTFTVQRSKLLKSLNRMVDKG
jgi:hypothetical protein